jgi:hypothetical protein
MPDSVGRLLSLEVPMRTFSLASDANPTIAGIDRAIPFAVLQQKSRSHDTAVAAGDTGTL